MVDLLVAAEASGERNGSERERARARARFDAVCAYVGMDSSGLNDGPSVPLGPRAVGRSARGSETARRLRPISCLPCLVVRSSEPLLQTA